MLNPRLGTPKNSQLTPAQRVAMKMGRRPCDVSEASSLCTLGKKQSGDASPTLPCRRPILIATKYLLFRGQDTRMDRPFDRLRTSRTADCFTLFWY